MLNGKNYKQDIANELVKNSYAGLTTGRNKYHEDSGMQRDNGMHIRALQKENFLSADKQQSTRLLKLQMHGNLQK